ncbi:MAG TPA: VanW family protein [Chloroflexota bacterium]|nr:VanW family protein [Chloroflexota bacterium]
MSSKPSKTGPTGPSINRRFDRPNFRSPRGAPPPRRVRPRRLDRPAFQRGGGTRKVDSLLRFGIFLGILVVLAGAIATFQHVYADRVSPHVSVGGIALGGVSLENAPSYLAQRVDARDRRPIVLHLDLPSGERIFQVNAKQFHAVYNLRSPLKAATEDGHGGDALTNLWNQFNTMLQGHDYAIQGTHDQQAVRQYLAGLDKRIDIAPQPAVVGIQDGRVTITRHMQSGTIIDTANAASLLSSVVDGHAVYDVTIPLLQVASPINDTVAQVAVDQAQTLLSQKTFFSSVNKVRAWYLTPQQLVRLLTFSTAYSRASGWKIVLHLDPKRLRATMGPIAAAVNRAPIPSVYTVADANGSAVPVPQPDGPGTLIDYDRTATAILNAASTSHSVVIPLLHPRAKFNQTVARAYGFDTALGRGPTSLVGASSSRMHNAGVAAAAVSNILLKPGAVFSLAKTEGPLTGVGGYIPGLNVVGRKDSTGANSAFTQVASALFHAAYDAGLPILARVSYPYLNAYNGPPGTDAAATALGEGANLRFRNNTAQVLLISVAANVDQVTAYIFVNGSQARRGVRVHGPVVRLNQDGSVDASISRAVSGDVTLQDSIATHYKALDPYP